MADAWGSSWGTSWGVTWEAGVAPPVVTTTTPTPAGGVTGRSKKRTVLIGDKTYRVNSLRDVDLILKRVVRTEAEPVTKAAKARIKVVDRVSATPLPEAFQPVPMPVAEVDWSALATQLAMQDRAYAEVLAKVLAKQEEEDIETLLMLI